MIDFSDGTEDSIKESNTTDYYYRCVASAPHTSNDMSFYETAVAAADEEFKQQQTVRLPAKPKPLQLSKIASLVKDEFETTVQFKERVLVEENRVTALNQANQAKHQVEIKNWDLKVEELNNIHQQKQASLDTNQIKLNAIRDTIEKQYGNPVIISADYNADEERFSIRMTSTKGLEVSHSNASNLRYLFDETIVIPVGIEFAKNVKKTLLASEFQPLIEVSARDNRIKIIGIKNLDNVNSLVKQKNEFEASYDSATKLNEFIKRYPDTSYTSKAKHRLEQFELQESEQRAMLKAKKEKEEQENKKKLAQQQQDNAMLSLGSCQIGSSVFHREKWNTTTSSGNIIADGLFGAATKEEFIIVYEGVVKGFVGEKVEVVINDFGVKQTVGGGFLQPSTWRKYDLNKHADKYLGKTQFYEKSRCE